MMLNTNQFSYQKDTKCFCTEASDIGLRFAPEAFDLKSSRTGEIVRMVLSKIDRDASGEDIYGWHFKTATESHDFTALIIND